MRTDDEVTNAFGMNATQIAESLREKYFQILCRKVKPTWKELPPSLRARWAAAVEILFMKCERQVQNVSAKRETEAFLDSIAGPETFKKLPRVVQVVWEAVLRHAINILVAGTQIEPGENPEELRREFDRAMADDWHDWVANKIKMEKKNA
jgi:hypothetical protein